MLYSVTISAMLILISNIYDYLAFFKFYYSLSLSINRTYSNSYTDLGVFYTALSQTCLSSDMNPALFITFYNKTFQNSLRVLIFFHIITDQLLILQDQVCSLKHTNIKYSKNQQIKRHDSNSDMLLQMTKNHRHEGASHIS